MFADKMLCHEHISSLCCLLNIIVCHLNGKLEETFILWTLTFYTFVVAVLVIVEDKRLMPVALSCELYLFIFFGLTDVMTL